MVTCMSSISISYQGNLSLIIMFLTEESDFLSKTHVVESSPFSILQFHGAEVLCSFANETVPGTLMADESREQSPQSLTTCCQIVQLLMVRSQVYEWTF